MQISGQVAHASSGLILLQTGEPHGYIDVYTNASTVISGAAPFVGEYVLVVGTGSLDKSITALSVTQKSSADAPSPIATPELSTVAGPVDSLRTNGFLIDSPVHGHLWVVTNAKTTFFGGTPTIGEYETVAGSGSFEGTYTATAASQTSAAPASTTVGGIIIAGTPYGFVLYASSTHPSVAIMVGTSSIVAEGTLEVGATASVTGAGSTSGPILAGSVAVTDSTPAATPPPKSPGAAATLPPMGVYNSCEIDTALPSCESQDSAIVQEGFQWEINQIGIAANATGINSLQAWFQYDASIGLGQVFFINKAINDPTNVLTGNILISDFDASLSNTCPGHPTTNEGIIKCIYTIASSVPGFKYEWYLYDEPGCPNQSIGYCAGTLAGGNYQNVQTLAQYIASIDPMHAVRGVNVGGGCGSGCYTASNAATEAATIANLYSCNGQSPCSAWSSPYTNNWLSSSYTPNTGFDYFPVPETVTKALIGDIGYIAADVGNTVAASYPSETISYTVQAFSWMQEGWTTQCSSSYTVCPFPTETQMQEMRDEALYYANAAGHPMSRIYWYDWPDLSCETAYSGCNSSANLAAVKSAVTAPFPATAPARNI